MKFLCLGLLLLSLALPAQAQEGEPISLSDLRAKYSDEGTRYITVDGVEVHYRDEGEGPVVLMLHASFFNLNAWDILADALMENHRVIRFDFPNAGLSGPETKEPTGGKFNLIGRNVEITAGLVENLGLEDFALIATSSGGSVGFRYAAQYPEVVNRLILINSAGMPRTAQTDPNRSRPDVAAWQAMAVKPMEFWQYSVNRNFPSLDSAPENFLELAYDVNRRTETTPFSKYYFETGDPQSIIGKIKAPTMILWGMSNPTVVHLEADVIEHWLTSAPSFIKKYEGLGHYPYVEAPDRVTPDVQAFLAGEYDDKLRITQRVKAAR